jgi:hypothetical protein
MDLFEISFTFNELMFLRSALDPISIQGKDARFVAALQIKLENEMEEIKNMIQEVENKKIEELQEAIKGDQKLNKKTTKVV